ncbi:MAG: hypothetical protein JWN16_357 [Alphaproteobacteria bacterium]|nr:hypothetical protein [Alphaproteobacteria bacterium]
MDTDNLLSFDRAPDKADTVAVEPVAPQPVAAAPAGDAFCRSVATQDATKTAFDSATVQRMLVQSYTQCLALSAR